MHFDGYFQVARGAPTTNDWATAEIHVNLTDLVLHSKAAAKGLGSMRVTRNSDFLSAGQVFASGGATALAKCRIATSVIFEASDHGMRFFNKEVVDGCRSARPALIGSAERPIRFARTARQGANGTQRRRG